MTRYSLAPRHQLDIVQRDGSRGLKGDGPVDDTFVSPESPEERLREHLYHLTSALFMHGWTIEQERLAKLPADLRRALAWYERIGGER